jgi:hypothetical protein
MIGTRRLAVAYGEGPARGCGIRVSNSETEMTHLRFDA